MKLGQRLLPREEQRLHAGSPTDATFVLTNPGGQKRSIQVWLEYANTKEVPVPPPDNVVLRTSAGQSIPVSEWTKPEPVVWKSPEVRQVEIEGDKPTLSLRVSDYKGDDRELGMQTLLAAGLRLAPLFPGGGRQQLQSERGVHNLACPADDARAMAAAVRIKIAGIFSAELTVRTRSSIRRRHAPMSFAPSRACRAGYRRRSCTPEISHRIFRWSRRHLRTPVLCVSTSRLRERRYSQCHFRKRYQGSPRCTQLPGSLSP